MTRCPAQEFPWQHNAQDSSEKTMELKDLGEEAMLSVGSAVPCPRVVSWHHCRVVYKRSLTLDNKCHSLVLGRGHESKTDSYGKTKAHKWLRMVPSRPPRLLVASEWCVGGKKNWQIEVKFQVRFWWCWIRMLHGGNQTTAVNPSRKGVDVGQTVE